MVLRREGLATAAALLTAAGMLVVVFLVYRTAEAGGALVYRYGAASAYASAVAGGGEREVPPE